MNTQNQQQAESQDLYLVGAHLVTERNGYAHHGIYIGSGRVIHYAGFCHTLHAAPVEETSIEQFADGHTVAVKLEPCARFVGTEAVSRARSRLGEDHYHLLTNNCEHFCTWCLLGQARSEQVETCLRHPRTAAITVLHMVRALLTGRHGGGMQAA
ncbi:MULTISPECIES: lecithin retinol acyltransferase family protein [unclassified Cupriavidus]|uniref:lecithin retinol acyltransferase family protein n=1 Tax=unclassified Cupriavidus TaxID=2640874 RepID=UPI0010F9EFA4|nr:MULTISPECIES: lecithin retinol acyltransferase family protein [unclassified Cupriavidus]MWL87984.1 NC domain protein [Cupriavidus sp. SW-Y-13]